VVNRVARICHTCVAGGHELTNRRRAKSGVGTEARRTKSNFKPIVARQLTIAALDVWKAQIRSNRHFAEDIESTLMETTDESNAPAFCEHCAQVAGADAGAWLTRPDFGAGGPMAAL